MDSMDLDGFIGQRSGGGAVAWGAPGCGGDASAVQDQLQVSPVFIVWFWLEGLKEVELDALDVDRLMCVSNVLDSLKCLAILSNSGVSGAVSAVLICICKQSLHQNKTITDKT